MGTIIISANVTLDGVVQDPDGGEGFAQGGWISPAGSLEREEWGRVESAEAMRTEALLLGRRSYEFFSERWSSRGGEWADRLNGLPKYVVSSTLSEEHANWGPTTLLRGDVGSAVSKLKQQHDGEIVVYASAQLAQDLLALDLVDELRVFVFPVVLGAGKRLFGPAENQTRLRLVQGTTIGIDLAYLTYEVVRSVPTARTASGG